MSRLTRFSPFSALSTKRFYSFFSSKPGGGRFFNSAKPPKVLASKPSRSPTRSNKTSNAEVESSPTPDTKQADETASARGSFTKQMPLPERKPLAQHPMLSLHDLQLHHFFSLHRPLLLIGRPTATLFESVHDVPAPHEPTRSMDASMEADAETARQLSRCLVINRVGNVVDWESALAKLGYRDSGIPSLESQLSSISMDSTKRKRRKKMKKHKCVYEYF